MVIDQRPFKKELLKLISDARYPVGTQGVQEFRAEVTRLVKAHRIVVSADQLSGQLAKLIMVNNKARAEKLVKALDDHALSFGGVVAMKAGKAVLKLLLLAGFILLVLWIAKWVGIL